MHMNICRLLLRFVALILGLEDQGSFPPPLTKSEESELFEEKKKGSRAARDKIIEHNLRLVSHIIKKYYASYENQDELLSIGCLGLIKAVDTFNAGYGTRFATYGARCVQNEILMFFRSKKKNGLEVSINDTIDIDKDGNPLTYLDIISTEENIEGELDIKGYTEHLTRLINTELESRERDIIVLRYGLCGYQPKTQREVASHLGISRSYVSRIEKHALEKLRSKFDVSGPIFDD